MPGPDDVAPTQTPTQIRTVGEMNDRFVKRLVKLTQGNKDQGEGKDDPDVAKALKSNRTKKKPTEKTEKPPEKKDDIVAMKERLDILWTEVFPPISEPEKMFKPVNK